MIFSRAFYISPNELRGFEIFVPKGCFVEKDGVIVLSADLVVKREETKQGITCFVLSKKKPNKAPEPTPTAVALSMIERSMNIILCSRERVVAAGAAHL